MPTNENLSRADWKAVPIEHAAAVDLISRAHYAGGAPNTSVARSGLVHRDEPDKLRGVALWLPPTRNAALSVDRDNPRGVLALSRLCVLDDVPRNGATFLLSRAMRMLDRSAWPTLLTYADTRHGHTGAIYRATGWEYLGLVPGSDAWIDAAGVQRGRKRGGRNYSAAEMVALGYRRLQPSSKHKFRHRA